MNVVSQIDMPKTLPPAIANATSETEPRSLLEANGRNSRFLAGFLSRETQKNLPLAGDRKGVFLGTTNKVSVGAREQT